MAATVRALPRRFPGEAFTAQDAVSMLDGANDYWSSHRVECGDCRTSPGGLCRDHDEDDRMAFLAGKLADALRAAGEDVLAALLGLAGPSTAAMIVSRCQRRAAGETAALVRGQMGGTR